MKERYAMTARLTGRLYYTEIIFSGKNAHAVPTIANTVDMSKRSQSRNHSFRLISCPNIFK